MKKIYGFIRPLVMFLVTYLVLKGLYVCYGVPFWEAGRMLTVYYALGLLRGAVTAVEVVQNEPGKR